MSRTSIAMILGLLLTSLLALWGWREAGRYDGLYKKEIELRVAAEARTAKIQSTLRAVSSNYASSELRLRRVLATIPDRGTPAAVYNELCQRANCAKPGAVQTSAD